MPSQSECVASHRECKTSGPHIIVRPDAAAAEGVEVKKSERKSPVRRTKTTAAKGKTTLAQVIANSTKSHFVTISAILAGKAELREVVEAALERRRLHNEHLVLPVKQILEAINSTRSIPFLN